ncbi:probable LRR receptor-like serine/threonine-protein kinase At3g47570 isoform X2 [Diospyros lotus]|nr:probable LRR receptor-like serine/threonine-protein kinase At3g47570 isoform X2 [Diospyros lotus]
MLVTSSWNDSLHFCEWRGVSCGQEEQRVTSLNLRDSNLAGTISPSIGNLSFLTSLYLSNNSFQGEIPSEIGMLSRLQFLDLNSNLLEGLVPVSLSSCHSLRNLSLDNNRFIGSIPKELGSLSQLVNLFIGSNNLTGSIPPSFGNLSSLEMFSAEKNMLEGSIPDSLGTLKSLKFLSLKVNGLSGIIPPSLYNVSSMTKFWVEDNELEGSLPQDLGLSWPNIQIISAWGNQLTGSVPVSISNVSSLEVLDLSYNMLSSRVAVNFGKHKNLWWLGLAESGLGTGDANDLDFISTLVNCSKLTQLSLGNNSFGGALPNSIANLSTELQVFSVHSNQIVGDIPADIGNLVGLNTLDLHSNKLEGPIPASIGKLSRLQFLYLNSNLLGGLIPLNFSSCHSLINLSLDNNNLVGSIPEELSSLSQLVNLFIGSNNLTGSIPPSFGNLSFLEMFSAEQNKLEGSIPDSLGSLKSLTFLSLKVNKLSGNIPPSLYNLSSMTKFWVEDNELEGSLPQDLGLSWPNIQIISAWGNQFTGSVPVSISNVSSLEVLDLSYNKLSSRVAVNFGKHKNLWWLALAESGLGTGDDDDLDFISTLVNCSQLRQLSLGNNSFGGALPNSIANLSTQLQVLSIHSNQIVGNIPADIGNLVGLNTLDVHSNQLAGPIPTSIGRLHKLQELGFGKNKFSGQIPSSIGNLTLLNQIWLEQNDFQGSIPPSIGNCKNLLLLHLYGNNLSGTIPREVVGLSSLSKSLDLSGNSLTDSLPREIGSLRNLVELNLSYNQLSGKIPSNLGSCSSLTLLYLDHNSLEGAIPESLSSLRGIEELDLSQNKLSGEIPEVFRTFTFLRKLNLSFNDLEGEVPVRGVFTNASAISVSGNNKLCGGISALQLQACASRKPRKNRGILITSIACVVLAIVLAVFLFVCWLRKRRKQPAVEYPLMDSPISMSYGQLLKATNGFSTANLIGTGGSGSVYKGIVDPNEKAIAVKVLHGQNRGASKSFMAECKALRNIRHRNLLKIISACASIDFQGNDFKALIYEFMENGSLDSWLHPVPQADAEDKQLRSLNLLQRLQIATDVASALDYLHNQCHEQIIHCDIKPSNILLDSDMTAHVGDFGLARFLHQRDNELSRGQISSIGVRGTIGYTAPEYGMGSELSTSGDVYSYGILLLELFTGRRPTDDRFKDNFNLHKLAKMALTGRMMEIVDPILLLGAEDEGESESSGPQMNVGKIHEASVWILKIGIACSEESSRERINIADAVAELHLVKDMILENRG